MKIAELEKYLNKKKFITSEYPFGPEALVYKVMGKMFALIMVTDNPLRMNLKCDPDNAVALRSMFPAILPGYHMNKEHWNTVVLDGSLPAKLIHEMIDASFDLVVSKLKKSDREKIQNSKIKDKKFNITVTA